MKTLLIILIPFILFAQTNPQRKDLEMYKGDYTVLQLQSKVDYSQDSVLFVVKPDRQDSSARLIERRSIYAGGSTSEISFSGKNILIKLLTSNTEGLAAATYVYDLSADSVTIFTGYLKIIDEVSGRADGVPTRTPYYIVALDTPNVDNTFLIGQDSTNIWYRRTVSDTRAILGIDTLTGGGAIPDSVVYPYEIDTLFKKTSHIVKIEEYVGALDTSLGWSLVIQAAVDANLGTGNTLLFNENKVYELQSRGTDPYQGSYNHSIDLKTGGVSLIIPPSTLLKLKDNQETTKGINIIVFRNASNIYIGGGGTIIGNTAGQPDYVGSYSQGDPAIIRGITSPANQILNDNVVIENLRLNDHFGCPVNISGTNNIILRNLSTYGVGEGFQLIVSKNILMDNLSVSDSTVTFVGDGIELSGCDYFKVTNCIVKGDGGSVGAGTAFDLYGSKYGLLSNFIINEWSSGGIAAGYGIDQTPLDDVIISSGIIKKCGGSAAYVNTNSGTVSFNNIYIDSCSIGIQIHDTLSSVAYLNNITVANGASSGILISGNSKVSISGGTLDNNLYGIGIVRTHAGKYPEVYINGVTLVNNATGLNFGNQGDNNWFPVGSISYLNLYNNTTDIFGGETAKNIHFSNLNLNEKTITGGDINVFGYNYAEISGGFTLNSLSAGYNGQLLTIAVKTPIGSGQAINDYRTSGGNIVLEGGQELVLAQGDRLTLRYDADSLRWYQVGISYNTLYGGTPLIVDGWYYDNVEANLTNASMLRGAGTITTRFYLTRNAYLRKLSVASNEARTAGTLTAELWWNGGGPNKTVVLDGTNPTTNTNNYIRRNTPLSAGTYLEIKITTSSDWTPTTADIQAWLELEY